MRDSVFFDVLVCDGRQYDAWGRRLAAGDWLGSEVFYQTPLYPYFLGLIYATVGPSAWAARIVQALLGSLACLAAARAGSLYFTHRVGWITGLLLAVYPPAIFFDGIMQKAALDLLFMTSLLWVTGAVQRQPRLGLFTLAGILLGGMTLNRENAVILIPLLAAWTLWLSWSEALRVKARRVVALIVGMAALLLPVGLRNYYVGGQFLLTTSQMGPNFYIGNHAGASGLYEPLRPGRGDPLFESLDARILAEEDLGRSLSPKEVSDYWMRRSASDIASDPIGWLKLLSRKWLLTWNTLELVDAESIRVHQRDSWLLWLFGWFWHFGTLCPLAAVGIWLTRYDWRRLWLMYAILAAFAAAVTMFFVFARYRYPLVPVCVLFSAAGLDQAYELWRRGAAWGRDLAVAAAVATLTAIFCNWPQPGLMNDEVSYITAGTGLIDDLRPEEALDVLKTAVEINPRSTAAYNNLGVAAIKLDRIGEARSYFERAAALDPSFPVPRQGLGEVYQRQGDRAAAVAQWKKALELDPFFAQPYRSLGSSELAAGNIDQAVRYLQRSLQLEPRSVAARVDLALAWLAQGKTDAARDELHAANQLIPQIREANNLAWILATAPDDRLRYQREALRWADFACRATEYKHPELLDTLAAAQANAGDFDAAARRADEAIRLARQQDKPALAAALQERRALYAAGRPYRDPQLASKAPVP